MRLNGNLLIEILPLRDLYIQYREHKRLKVFVHKGRTCVTCGREGKLLLISVDKAGGRHVDLYTDDFVLMTVDHIFPRSQARKAGWGKRAIESLKNKQPMCSPCNGAKGNKMITNEQHREVRASKNQRRTGLEIIRQMVYNENIFNKNIEGLV